MTVGQKTVCQKTVCQKAVCQKGIMPKSSMPKGDMPNDSMPKGDYAKKQYAKWLHAKRHYAKRLYAKWLYAILLPSRLLSLQWISGHPFTNYTFCSCGPWSQWQISRFAWNWQFWRSILWNRIQNFRRFSIIWTLYSYSWNQFWSLIKKWQNFCVKLES